MSNNNGKIILSLLAGATAGVVAGLLLAPETGDQTRQGLKQSASKWGGDLSKLFQDTLSKVKGAAGAEAGANAAAATSEDREAADALFNSMGSSADQSIDQTADSDYDGIAGDSRHQPKA